MANEQLRERLARYIDQYKDDKESGVNMGTVGLAMGYKSGCWRSYPPICRDIQGARGYFGGASEGILPAT